MGETGKVAGSPVAVVHSNGSRDVYYRGTDGALWDWFIKSPSEWSLQQLGYGGVVAGDPDAVVSPSGLLDVYYGGSEGGIWNWYEAGSGWYLQERGPA
jgi:hypothetical protein